jgi:hypothetical protein
MSLKEHPILFRPTLVISLFLLAATEAWAHGNLVRARVRSVTGIARIYPGPQSAAFFPKRNDPIEPGNIIETLHNGRVVISLSDGGLITVLPNSRVVLKDFLVAHSARELLDIVFGRVLVKIRSASGKPNPYRLNSPAASIAVRGTEFIVDVLPGGETLVLVREGLVEVWPHNQPDKKRLLTPGGKVSVRPGGDISLAFPGPGSELNGRSRFDSSLEENYQRSIDSVAQNSKEICPVFFSAFPDPHLDSLENPAYGAEFKNAEGRLLLLPSISAPYHFDENRNSSSKARPRFDYSASPQLTFYTPIPGSRLVIGVGASAYSARLQNLTDFEFSDFKHYDHEALRLNAFNASLIAAYSFGVRGRTSVGISIDELSGDGSFSSEIRYKTDSSNREYFDNSYAEFARGRMTLGVVHSFSESSQIGLYYRHGFSSSYQENIYHRNQKDGVHPFASHFLSSKTNTSTRSSELGVRFRASLTRRLFYGVEGSYLYERIRSRRETPNQPIEHSRYPARRARLGGGLGFAITPKILLNFDIAGGIFNNSEPALADGLVRFAEDVRASGANIFASASLSSSPRSSHGEFLSAHAAIQTNLWRNLFLSASSLRTFRADILTYSHSGDSFSNKNVYGAQLSNVGIGWNFNPNIAAEYLFSIDHRYRLPSHSFKLRYTFKLSDASEK